MYYAITAVKTLKSINKTLSHGGIDDWLFNQGINPFQESENLIKFWPLFKWSSHIIMGIHL